jgi:DNA-binding LacI/PurR family transcriptional regulator
MALESRPGKRRYSASKRATIFDVAAAAGVSRGTVSRVTNGGHWVSPEALARVNAAIRSTGYVANRHARSLVTGRANSVAFLLTEPQHLLFEDPTFSLLLRSAARELGKREVSLVLMVAGTADEKRRITEYVSAGHVDGVFLTSRHAGSPMVAELLRKGVPTITSGRPLGLEAKIGYVTADDSGGARVMVRHLSGLGRLRIATITGPLDTSGGLLRLEGYRHELGELYDESLVAHGDYTRSGGETAMRELLDRRPDLDAVFVASDLMAAGALTVLAAAGRLVPDDVAVGGFDDSGLAETLNPPLTTMQQPFARIAHEMVRLLLDVVEGKEIAAVTLPLKLVLRASTTHEQSPTVPTDEGAVR